MPSEPHDPEAWGKDLYSVPQLEPGEVGVIFVHRSKEGSQYRVCLNVKGPRNRYTRWLNSSQIIGFLEKLCYRLHHGDQ